MSNLNIGLSFAAGFVSFISPCTLPLYPSYLSYITGISVSDLKDGSKPREIRVRTMTHTFFFLLGFSLLFYTLGYGVNAFADFFADYQALIRQISAILIILMGLFLVGLFQPQFMMKQKKLNLTTGKTGYLGSFIFGVGFSAGWSPCVGPILTLILGLQASNPGSWFQMTTAYALGFAIPFFVLAFFLSTVRAILRYSNTFMKIGGGLMVVMGLLLFTNQMTEITIWLNSMTPEWMKF
jgi:cytochrome c-type biogenesis protein